MNFKPLKPNANEHFRRNTFEPLSMAALEIGWIVGATELLAELGCAAAALAFYLSQEFYGNIPAYLEYLPFFMYLVQGLFFVWKGRTWVAEWTAYKRPWWKLIIAVLGWPMHHALVTFHEKTNHFDDLYPSQMMSLSLLRENLVFSLLCAFGAWVFGLWIALIILVVLDQGLGLF
jgi:hypothetical protein